MPRSPGELTSQWLPRPELGHRLLKVWDDGHLFYTARWLNSPGWSWGAPHGPVALVICDPGSLSGETLYGGYQRPDGIWEYQALGEIIHRWRLESLTRAQWRKLCENPIPFFLEQML